MAVRGANEKLEIQNKILEMFPGAFPYEKHIRVPMGDVQIKITLTTAKSNVGEGADTAVPGEKVEAITGLSADGPVTAQRTEMREPTEAEKKNISELLKMLNL